jgi:Domain of unknown function (DUF4384)
MLVSLGWLLVLAPFHTPLPLATLPKQEPPQRQPAAGRISVWTDREQPYRRGQSVRLYFRAERPGYVTVLRIDTDGRLRALFPREPWGQSHVGGDRTVEVADSRGRSAFLVEDNPGIGYVFAVTSPHPFDYQAVTRGDYWDFRLIDRGRVRGDPYVALTDLARTLAPRGDFTYDIAPYHVDRIYDYPRFVCYDCHSYARRDRWDPYAAECARYRVVVYDDPTYYPYRYNQGRSVAADRPLRPAPRYVFRDAEPGTEYVTRLRRRESHNQRGSRVERGRTSADVGGKGVVPAPSMTRTDGTVPRARDERGPVLRRDLGDTTTDQPRTAEREPPKREPRKVPPVQRGAGNPQSTGEPELRRRKP